MTPAILKQLKAARSKGPKGSHLERKFAVLWASLNGFPLETQYKFDPVRRWKFDFAYVVGMVAIEIEGGIWLGKYGKGAHSTGKAIQRDCEKYFAAAVQGWTVFRLTPNMITREYCKYIRDFIGAKLEAGF